MDVLVYVLGALVLVAAAAAVWLGMERGRLAVRLGAAEGERDAVRADAARLSARLEGADQRVVQLQVDIAAREAREHAAVEFGAERARAFAAREAELKASIAEMTEKFKSVFAELSGKALQAATDQLSRLAGEQRKAAQAEIDQRREAVDKLVEPIQRRLAETTQLLAGLSATSTDLKAETIGLVRALSKPEVRGRYGEIQLKRVAELAGMKAYCDFSEQESQRDGDGRVLRPDMTVKLPNDRRVVVDAKTNTLAYMEAANARTDAERESCLERFAGHVADQVAALSRKQYWANDPGAYDFVVMFMPGDQFLDAALARRPDLLEKAAELNVIIASPSTLIGLLRAVAVGWREKRIEEQAKELFQLGRELHERAAVAFEHVADLGRSVGQVVERYNKVVGSVETRLLPTLRKFEETGVKGGKEIAEPAEVTVLPRQPMLLPDSP